MIVVKSDDLEIALSRRRPDQDLIIRAGAITTTSIFFRFKNASTKRAFDNWVSNYLLACIDES